MGRLCFFLLRGIAVAVLPTFVGASDATAETLSGALAKAYQQNSSLNSVRAASRATAEGVAIAKSGYRPVLSGVADIDYLSTSGRSPGRITTGSFGIEIRQNIFDGFQTRNNVAAAKAQVQASIEGLRNTEQNTLFDAASTYMDVIRDRRIALLTSQNLQFLVEQVRAARSRLDVGEGTRTDVAQAEASRAGAVAVLARARAQAASSEATYRQVVGDEPDTLVAAKPITKLLPKELGAAYYAAEIHHPAILASLHLVDAAAFSVKSNEGALLPQLAGSASLRRDFLDSSPNTISDGSRNSASIGLTLTVPIYQGGRVSARVRQSKESLGQARIDVDVNRDLVRQAVVSAWSQYLSADQSVQANRDLVAAAQIALAGVIQERDVGQRTTLDVLNAQSDVITAQINLANSDRDVVVASYAILSAVGNLSALSLGLTVTEYDPKPHADAVADKWIGLRTLDGR